MTEGEDNLDKQRVNNITAVYDNDSDCAVLTMYRTHKKLGQLNSGDIGIQSFSETKAKNKTTYLAYCKEVLINLLENGGVDGYYYDPGESTNTPKKYDSTTFKAASEDTIVSAIMAMNIDGLATIKVDNIDISTSERYKDGFIKYSTANASTTLTSTDGRGVNVGVIIEIKSGQLCKPRNMVFKSQTIPINQTNIKRLFKGGDANGKA